MEPRIISFGLHKDIDIFIVSSEIPDKERSVYSSVEYRPITHLVESMNSQILLFIFFILKNKSILDTYIMQCNIYLKR